MYCAASREVSDPVCGKRTVVMTSGKTLSRLARDARPYAPRLLVAIAMGTIGGLTNLVAPWGFGQIINRVITARHPDVHALYAMLMLIFCALIVGALATYGQAYLMAWSGQHLIARMRARLFERVLRLPLGEFARWRPGELISRFSSDLQMMTDAVSISLPQLLTNGVTFLSSFVVMVKLDWLLTCSLIVVAPIISIAVSRFSRLISASTLRSQQRVADLNSTLSEALTGQRIIKAFGREDYESARFGGRNDEYFGTYMKLTQFIQTQPLVLSTLMSSAIVAIIWLSTREVVVGRLNVGELFMYWGLLANLINPMNRFAAFVGDLTKAVVGAGRVYEILDLPVERADKPGAVSLTNVRGEITFEHVRFAYTVDEPAVLDDFNATIAAGEIVALVGPSGAGKTTIVNLVPRFYEPQSGRITIDGVDLDDLRLADLRTAIGIVPQEAQLFRGTIADNIRYGRLEATDAEVREAAREANVEEFIRTFPDGYATEVGERGLRLSGGQRQRVAIARAILRNPRILILDEATSALDSHSEALIEQALDRLLPGRTTLIIAHRLSTIRRADTILYIEAGRVLEMGSHEALLAKGGAYARLHATQFA
ncbi:MAG TPA: ABC transporter ATP-binding protein [Candidatus Baltobacteraceae bacterium]|jgi:subfamily B ATP-binding cassette protein MsbA|nr:ABC transporter ATP-binding protein [Candidatus Baltobacteraceae bacterium]